MIRIQNQNTESGYRIRIQDQNTGSGFRIRIQDQDTGSGYRARIQDQNIGSGYRISIMNPTKEIKFPDLKNYVLSLFLIKINTFEKKTCNAS